MCNKKLKPSIQSVAILCLVLGLIFSAVSATYYDSKTIGENGGTITINSDAKITIPKHALSDYLDKQGISSVEITVEMVEVYDGEGNLDTLVFTFGPDGCTFAPELELRLKGDYLLPNYVLMSEEGEALEYTTQGNGNLITFYIPHFSRYSYDMYDY